MIKRHYIFNDFYRYWPKCQSTQFLIDQEFCYHRRLGVRQQPWGNNPIYLMLWKWRRVLYWMDVVASVTRPPTVTPQNFNIATSFIIFPSCIYNWVLDPKHAKLSIAVNFSSANEGTCIFGCCKKFLNWKQNKIFWQKAHKLKAWWYHQSIKVAKLKWQLFLHLCRPMVCSLSLPSQYDEYASFMYYSYHIWGCLQANYIWLAVKSSVIFWAFTIPEQILKQLAPLEIRLMGLLQNSTMDYMLNLQKLKSTYLIWWRC